MVNADDLGSAYRSHRVVHIETMYNHFDGVILRYDANMIDLSQKTRSVMIPVDMVERFT